MKKLILKKTNYTSKFEAVLAVVFGLLVCTHLMYTMLTGKNNESSQFVLLAFAFGAGILIFGLWKFITKKPAEYVDVNGWKYRLFQKANKWRFICISGLTQLLSLAAAMVFLFIIDVIKFNFLIILFLLVALIISGLIYGIIEYKKYNAVDLDSDF